MAAYTCPRAVINFRQSHRIHCIIEYRIRLTLEISTRSKENTILRRQHCDLCQYIFYFPVVMLRSLLQTLGLFAFTFRSSKAESSSPFKWILVQQRLSQKSFTVYPLMGDTVIPSILSEHNRCESTDVNVVLNQDSRNVLAGCSLVFGRNFCVPVTLNLSAVDMRDEGFKTKKKSTLYLFVFQ